jgi:hypothetical protein
MLPSKLNPTEMFLKSINSWYTAPLYCHLFSIGNPSSVRVFLDTGLLMFLFLRLENSSLFAVTERSHKGKGVGGTHSTQRGLWYLRAYESKQRLQREVMRLLVADTRHMWQVYCTLHTHPWVNNAPLPSHPPAPLTKRTALPKLTRTDADRYVPSLRMEKSGALIFQRTNSAFRFNSWSHSESQGMSSVL